MNEIKKNYQTAMLYKYVCQTLSKNKACSKKNYQTAMLYKYVCQTLSKNKACSKNLRK